VTTATLTLVEFLLARIAEDQRRARDLVSVSFTPRWLTDGNGKVIEKPAPEINLKERLLAECEAKRRIMEAARHAEVEGGGAAIVMFDGYPRDGIVRVLAALALPYADHPDFREEWRP
jgi:hypothetical protein